MNTSSINMCLCCVISVKHHSFSFQNSTGPSFCDMSRLRLICCLLMLMAATMYVLLGRSATFPLHKVSYMAELPDLTTNFPKRFMLMTSKNFTFHKVGPMPMYVFSAFLDPRFGNLIRMVGMAMKQDYSKLRCVILSDGAMETTPIEVQFLPEGHNLK